MSHHDAPKDEYAFQFSLDSDSSPSIDIVEAVAWVKGMKPTNMESLAEHIDPDALDSLYKPGTGRDDFNKGGNETTEEAVRLQFTYADFVVTVQGPDRFTVKPDN